MFRYRRLAMLAAIANTALVLIGGSAQAAPPAVFNPVVEAQLSIDSTASTAQALATRAADPGRLFTDDLCWNLANGGAGRSTTRSTSWSPLPAIGTSR